MIEKSNGNVIYTERDQLKIIADIGESLKNAKVKKDAIVDLSSFYAAANHISFPIN